MKVSISNVFLISAIFLCSLQLSSQAERPPLQPFPPQEPAGTEAWRDVRANEIVPMPNGGFYKARFDGPMYMFYQSRHGNVLARERGLNMVVYPAGSYMDNRRRKLHEDALAKEAAAARTGEGAGSSKGSGSSG